jgi:hypothetical protein
MSNLEHLSNEELVSTFQHLVGINQIYNKNIKKEIALKAEILRRLNEPWRRQKNDMGDFEEKLHKITLNYLKQTQIISDAFDNVNKSDIMPIFREDYDFLLEWAQESISEKGHLEEGSEKKLKAIEEAYGDE